MKNVWKIIQIGPLVVAVMLLLTPCFARAATEDVYSVALLNFSTRKVPEELGEEVALLLNVELSSQPNLMLAERAELDKVLSEQELGLSGAVSPETAARIGQILGAKVVVTGKVFESGQKRYLVAKIIGTETSRVFGEMHTVPSSQPLLESINPLSEKIAKTIRERGTELVPAKKSEADVVGELKTQLAGKKLPSVSVAVSERQIGAATIDPAVETELGLVLKQLGFTLVDAANKAVTPDVAITGEAFSEVGMRKGNLVSVKGRAEVKAVNVATGEVLGVDRETTVTIDSAENIAGKSALQRAALSIAQRLIPKLVQ